MLASLVLAALFAATPTVDLDRLLATTTPQVRRHTGVPILLPRRLPVASSSTKLYPEASAAHDRYAFRLATTRNCTATHCLAATLSGERGSRTVSGRTVRLARGRKGVYHPMSCGASCAPAEISWKERRVTYTFAVVLPAAADQRRLLTGMANAAIRRGPR